MERITGFLIILLISLSARSQNGYWYDSTWVELTPTENEIVLNTRVVQPKTSSYSIIACAEKTLKSMNLLSGIYRLHVRKSQHGDSIIVLPRLICKLKDGYTIDNIANEFKNIMQLDVVTNSRVYKFNCNVQTDSEVLSIVNKIILYDEIEWCEPNMIMPIHLYNTYYSQQYYLKNTGQNGGTPGIDINAEAAWQITSGSPLIKIAVIDSGVDINHEDLSNNIIPGYTIGDSAGNGACVNTWLDSEHGTPCAGIIGAIDNNIGIRGVASGSKIVPVNYITPYANIDSLAEAIRWSYNHADVLSCSWGIDDSAHVIEDAIDEATTLGRHGKGCVVVAAAGNDTVDQAVRFPANLNNVIAVGAVDKNGIIWDYSCRGPELDLVAPTGENFGPGDVVTTDITGYYGFNHYGNYCFDFGGTSAACPQVAGVAALMLSINPTLTASRVKTILQITANNIGTTVPNNTYGYGLVDAGAAVNKAKTELPAFTTSKTYNGENEMTVTVSAANNNFSYYFTTEWTVLAGNMTISATGSNYCTLTKSTSGLPTGVVMMKVKFGDKVLYTTVVGLNISDVAKYRQEACTYYGVGHPAIPLTVINSGGQAHVHQGCRVYLNNQVFGLYQNYGNITHSGITPDDWYVANDHVEFALPLGSGGIPFGVQVRDNSGTLKYQYIFFTYSGNGNSSLSVNPISSTEYEISLCEDDDNQIVSQSNDDALSAYGNSEQTWRLEVYNTWDASKVYDHEIFGDKATLDTSGWRVGTYAIRAIRGDQVYTEKMLVK